MRREKLPKKSLELEAAIDHAQMLIDDSERRIIRFADMYSEFPAIDSAVEQMLAVLEKRVASEEADSRFAAEVAHTIESVRAAVEVLALSLNMQRDLNVADKRWMRDPNALEGALKKGRLVMELDVRLDKNGEPWISHSTKATDALFGAPLVHMLSTEELQGSDRFPLEKGLQQFSRYQENGHRLLLELKTLGDDPAQFAKHLQRLQELVRATGTEGNFAIASLSPGILMAAHQAFPDTPLILNGGIAPVISHKERGPKLANAVLPHDSKWRALGIPGKFEVVMSAAENTFQQADGHGTQTGYVMTRLPQDLVDVFKKQRQNLNNTDMGRFAGVVSLSSVTMLASALDAVGATERATAMRTYYSEMVDELGLGKMATTWGQELSRVPGLHQLDAQRQLDVFKRELGLDTLVYTKSPEEWAHVIPADITHLLVEE